MEIFSNITFNEYIPDVAPNGLFSKKKPIVFNGEPIKSREVGEILALLKPDITNKLCTYISFDIIRIRQENEILLKFLPETEIKMLEIFNEIEYNKWDSKKKNYMMTTRLRKEYIFWMTEDNEDYANVLYLLHTDQFNELLTQNELNTIESISSGRTTIYDIIEGICLGYPVDYIKGYYTSRNIKPNFYDCIQGRNITQVEKTLLFEELNEFLDSNEYKELSNRFSENYSLAVKLIDRMIESKEFDDIVRRNRKITLKCTPDYSVVTP